MARVRFILCTLLITATVFGIGAPIHSFGVAVHDARERARRSGCTNNVKQFTGALYSFPPNASIPSERLNGEFKR